MKLFEFNIKTYLYGIKRYKLYVLAGDEEDARQLVWQYPKYRHDQDAEIESVREISLETPGIIE